MSYADELLNSLSEDGVMALTAESSTEPHIIIGSNRKVSVPDELKRIAVQYDHNVETVTFDCPRYWDEHDMSQMKIYINYKCPGGSLGCYIVDSVTIDEADNTIMHFDWTISRNATLKDGNLSFLVCIRKIDAETGEEVNHWNSELNMEMYISKGLECNEITEELYPDIITQLLLRMDSVEAVFAPTVEITEIEGGHHLKMIDVNGTYEFDVMNGAKGDKGDKGDTGDTGAQGPQGETGPQGPVGAKGEKGESGVYYGADTPGEEFDVWINPDGTPGGSDTIESALGYTPAREEDVTQLKQDLADLTVESEEKKTHMENPEHHAGYWWNGEQKNDSYFYVKLSVNAGDVIHAINTLNNRVIAVRFVDAYSGANRVGDASSSTDITEYTVPATVDTLYLSINAPEDAKDYIQIKITEITVIKSIIVPFNKNGIMTKISSLASGYLLTACENFDVKKNQSYRFYARFDTFDSVCVCHGYNTYGGSWIEVGETNITAYYYNGSSAVQMGQWAHGLSISDFVEVIVNVGDVQNLRAKVTVMSETGDFTQDNVPMGGCTGGVSAFGRQSMADVSLSYSIGDLSTDVWLFGDSYISLGDPNRWTHKLMDYGYKNLLMSGFSGATSADQIKSFRNLISIGRPKYLVWALGMNDSDTDGAVNANWKESFDEVSAWCNLNKIQFIACTIPNTPRVRNVEKNEIVRLSGYRYVDFAKAVNAEEVGSTWYPGMLSTDDVHPIELGAKVLANRFLVDVPEVIG